MVGDLLHEEHESDARHHMPINLLENTLVQRRHLRLREIPQKRESRLDFGGGNVAVGINGVFDTFCDLSFFIADVSVADVVVDGSSHGGDGGACPRNCKIDERRCRD